MVQTYPIPISEESLGKEAVDIDNAFEALRSNFAAASFPVAPSPIDGQTFWHNVRKIWYVFDGLLSTWLPLAGSSFSKTITNSDTPYAHGLADGTLFCDMSSGVITIDLAAISTVFAGYRLRIYRSGDLANALTIDPNSAETINGASTLVIGGEYQSVELEADPTVGEWRIMAQHGFVQGASFVNDHMTVDGDTFLNADGLLTASDIEQLVVTTWKAFSRITQTEITGDQDDYALGAQILQRLSSDATRSISGFVSPGVGTHTPKILINVGSQNIDLLNENVGSSATNRIITGTAGTVTLGNTGEAFWMLYDDVSGRWRLIR